MDVIILGWREWVALPQLGVAAVKAKVDSGARTSALHVESIEESERDGGTWLRFVVLTGRRKAAPIVCEAAAIDTPSKNVCISSPPTAVYAVDVEISSSACISSPR